MSELRSIHFLDVEMHPWTMEQTVAEIDRRLDADEFTQHVVVNVAKLVNMRDVPALRDAVTGCDIINIDGMGVVWGARLLGYDVPERVAGIDLFFRLLELSIARHESVFLLGARESVVAEAAANLQRHYPNLDIAGFHHGYFWDDEESVVEIIRNSGASMLFVAITSPKKEQFIHRWKSQLGVSFAMGVGGTFDIVAGKTHRAPKWMQDWGLEWLYRVIQEPGRMWKRYLITNSKFAGLLAKSFVSPRR